MPINESKLPEKPVFLFIGSHVFFLNEFGLEGLVDFLRHFHSDDHGLVGAGGVKATRTRFLQSGDLPRGFHSHHNTRRRASLKSTGRRKSHKIWLVSDLLQLLWYPYFNIMEKIGVFLLELTFRNDDP